MLRKHCRFPLGTHRCSLLLDQFYHKEKLQAKRVKEPIDYFKAYHYGKFDSDGMYRIQVKLLPSLPHQGQLHFLKHICCLL